jgi:DNA-binding winged helix-turn-helix (wHTH) protein
VQISRLRRKIETNLKDPAFIKTIRYGGYFFTPQVTATADSLEDRALPEPAKGPAAPLIPLMGGGSGGGDTVVAADTVVPS